MITLSDVWANGKGTIDRQKYYDQVLFEKNAGLLEHILLLSIIKSFRFYVQMKHYLCPRLDDGRTFREDFTRPDFNRVYAVVAQFWESIAHMMKTGDMSIGSELMDLILAHQVTKSLMTAEEVNIIEITWLTNDIETIEIAPELMQSLPSNPMFLQWLESRAVAHEHMRLAPISLGHAPGLADLKASVKAVEASITAIDPYSSHSMQDVTNAVDKPPAALVEDVLPINGMVMIAGRAKSYKSWSVIDLAVSLAAKTHSSGYNSWYKFKIPHRAVVAYADFEMCYQRGALDYRINRVCQAYGIDPLSLDGWLLPEDCRVANLLKTGNYNNGTKSQFVERVLNGLADKLEHRFEGNHADRAVILDSLYKIHCGTLDENSPQDMTFFYALLRDFMERLKCAVVLVHHFSKGFAHMKQAGDQAAGTRVHRQEVDGIVEITPLQQPRMCRFSIESRHYRDVAPFALSWNVPVLRVAPEVDPTMLAGKPGGRHLRVTGEQILAVLADNMTRKEWYAAVTKAGMDISIDTFDNRRDELVAAGKVLHSDENKYQKAQESGVQ